MRSTPCLIGFVLTLTLTVPAAAQTVGGTYTDTETGEPLEGAVVLLVSEAGDQVAGTLSRSDGSFIVLAPAPGRYRLEGRLIGYETVRTSYFAVARGEVAERSLSARVRAIGLEGLTAEVRPRCEARPDATGAGQRLWDEARAALEAVSLTHDAEAIRFEARRWSHDLDPETGRVTEQVVEPVHAVRGHPFSSVPVGGLLEHGFVREVKDTVTYYAPDARALLSDPFLSTHCFWAVDGGDGRIGLAFRPVPERQDVRDVRGTLWLDRASGELRTLEFRYTNVSPDAADHGVGGGVSFERLANGAWVVDEWRIRMPYLGVVNGRGPRVVGLREAGGEIISVRGLGTTRIFEEPVGVIEGRILSEEGVPIPDALVYLSGTAHADTADAEGSFRFPNVREGRYALAWFHEELAQEAAVEARHVEVVANEASTPTLTIAGVDRWLAGGCTAAERRDGTGVVFGMVRDAETAVPVGGLAVRLVPAAGADASFPVVAQARSRAVPARLEVVAERSGEFRFCAVEPGEYALEASVADRMAGSMRVSVAAGARVERTLALEPTTVARADAERAATRPARIVGRVVDGVGGSPVAAAAVQVGDSGRVRLTDERGRFLLDGVPAGTRIVRVTHAAFEPVETAVVAESGALVELEVALGPVELEPLEVVAIRRGYLADVYWRMARGTGGQFIGTEEIERRSPTHTAQILQGQRGWEVTGAGRGLEGQLRSPRGNCAPSVYLDGVPIYRGGSPDEGTVGERTSRAAKQAAYASVNMVHPSEVEVIELYAGAATVPPEFGGSTGGCGVIAIWTRRGNGPGPRQ